MEGQDAGVDTEQGVPAQHFHVAVGEVESVVVGYGGGIDGRLVVGIIWDCEVG